MQRVAKQSSCEAARHCFSILHRVMRNDVQTPARLRTGPVPAKSLAQQHFANRLQCAKKRKCSSAHKLDLSRQAASKAALCKMRSSCSWCSHKHLSPASERNDTASWLRLRSSRDRSSRAHAHSPRLDSLYEVRLCFSRTWTSCAVLRMVFPLSHCAHFKEFTMGCPENLK